MNEELQTITEKLSQTIYRRLNFATNENSIIYFFMYRLTSGELFIISTSDDNNEDKKLPCDN